MDKISKKVVRLVEGHPEGIPLSKLAVFYNQKYRNNLIVSEAGFSNIADFIASLTEHLVVKDHNVFHKRHVSQTQDNAEEEEVTQSSPEGTFLVPSVRKKKLQY